MGLLLVLWLSAPAGAPPAVAQPAHRPTGFTVGGWMVNNAFRDGVHLARFEEAGFDYLVAEDIQVKREFGEDLLARLDSLRAARPGFRMKAIVAWHAGPGGPGAFTRNEAPAANRAELARTFAAGARILSPSALGWLVWDEPCPGKEMEAALDLAQWMRGLPVTRGGFPLVNLFPITEEGRRSCFDPEGSADRVANYRRYLESYLRGWEERNGEPAPVLCFDMYPFQNTERPGVAWFEALSVASAAARDFSRPGRPVPLWVVVQLSPYAAEGRPFFRTPTFEQTRFQVWSAVAYGARSVAYWTVGQAFNGEKKVGFGPGVLDDRGNKQPRFAQVQALNRELRALAPMLGRLEWRGALHAAPGRWRVAAAELATTAAASRPALPVRSLEGNGRADALVGTFRDPDNGEAWLVVVNKHLESRRAITVRLAARADAVERLDPATGKLVRVAGAGDQVSLELGPAAATLCRVVGSRVE